MTLRRRLGRTRPTKHDMRVWDAIHKLCAELDAYDRSSDTRGDIILALCVVSAARQVREQFEVTASELLGITVEQFRARGRGKG